MKEYKMGSKQEWPSNVVIFTDGASRGNPGDASLGLVVYDNQENELFCYGKYLGQQTNNYAEYSAVKAALLDCVDNQIEGVTIKSDSQLLVRQITGQYKVKSEGLKPLFKDCIELINNIKSFKIEHVRREYNKRADQIANLVLDTM